MYCGVRDCWALCSSEAEGNLSVTVVSFEDSSVLSVTINSFIHFGLWVLVSAMALMQDRHDIKVLTRSAFYMRSILPTVTINPWRLVVL